MTIDVTNCDLRKLISTAYELSSPQGLGFLQSKAGALSDAEIDNILASGTKHFPVEMDYVNGRSIKMHVRLDDDGKLTMYDRWYDHSAWQLQQLCEAIGANYTVTE